MTKSNITKLEHLTYLSGAIRDNFSHEYDFNNMEIVFSVDKNTLKRINEDMFYACNPASMSFPEDVDEIKLEVNEIKFKYIIEEDE